jgi:hypothetical protein
MTKEELYAIYYRWTGQLHNLVGTQLGEHVDVEYFPDDYLIKVYSGAAQDADIRMFHTVPGIVRPHGEKRETIKLPRPEDDPTMEDLNNTFRALCLAVAKVLGIKLSQLTLDAGPDEEPEKKHALPERPMRLRNRKKK